MVAAIRCVAPPEPQVAQSLVEVLDKLCRRSLPRPLAGLRNLSVGARLAPRHPFGRMIVNGIIYLIGLVVVILAILSFFGLR
jgi:hypothetical protein